jgi:uncharacterized membrane protein
MQPRARNARDIARLVVVAACAASAGVHAALVPEHLEHEPALGAAFVAAAVLTLALSAGLAIRPSSAAIASLATLVLATLIAAYALSVTTGIPGLSDGPERADAVGLATKAVEAAGLFFALQLTTTKGGREPLAHEEAPA